MKRLLKDFVINIFSIVIPIAILQLVVLPKISYHLGKENYGLIITLLSLISLFSETFGNVLNNTRLLLNKEYKEKKLLGDFNLILLSICLVNVIAITLGVFFYQQNIFELIGVILCSTLILVRAYLLVFFRLELNYKEIFINNILLSFGYLIGYLIFLKTLSWIGIYFIANILGVIHLVIKTDLMKEGLRRTSLIKKTSKKYIILYAASIMAAVTTYSDRLIIYPLLGPVTVGYYYAASIIGKMFSMCIGPISSVLLSYIVKLEKIEEKDKKKLIGILFLLGSFGYILAWQFGKVLLGVLYPDWNIYTFHLLPLTVGTAIFNALSSVLRPFVLRFKDEKYQLFINGSNLLVYLFCVTLFTLKFEIVGFCIGILLTSIIRFIIFTYLFLKI